MAAGFRSILQLRAASVILIGFSFGIPALADTLEPFVGAGVSHEDNLFRLADDELRVFDGGSDTSRSVNGGIRFTRPISRQLISGVAEVSSVKFDRNSQLDYTRRNLSGEWRWFFAAHFDGRIGASYMQELAPFSDFHAVERNLRVTRKQYADGNWRLHPSWRWRIGYTKAEYAYDLVSQRGNDRKEKSAMTGVDYLAASGSTFGIQVRRLEGRYPYAGPIGAGVRQGYVQDEAKANILWLATGTTQILFLGGWAQRKSSADAGRVRSGTNARLSVNWTPAGRVKLVGQTWREFSAIEGALIDSALSTGASADATWELTGKMQAVGSLKHETREFVPYGGAAVSLPAALLRDSSNTVSAGLAYKPLRNVVLNLNLYRDRRSGSVAAGTNSYKVNGAAFNASMQF